MKPNLTRIPTIPRYWEQQNEHFEEKVDEETRNSWRISSAICDLSEMLYQDVSASEPHTETGSREDIERRLQLYMRLLELRSKMPADLWWETHPTPHNLYLR